MKKIVGLSYDNSKEVIDISSVGTYAPIFAKQGEKLVGMVIKEVRGWALCLGGSCKIGRYHASREECMRNALTLGYTFFVEE